MQCQPGSNGQFHNLGIQYRQHPGETSTNRAGLGVGLSPKGSGTRAKYFAAGFEFSMDFEAYYSFIVFTQLLHLQRRFHGMVIGILLKSKRSLKQSSFIESFAD